MSTNALVGYRLPGNKVRFAYIHNDGYPEWTGKVLKDHYHFKKFQEMIEFGHMSVIGPQIHPTDPDHSFEEPERDEDGWPLTCVFYDRDRGEKGRTSKVMSEDEFLSSQTYAYIMNELDIIEVYKYGKLKGYM